MKNSQMIDKNEFIHLIANIIGLNALLAFPRNMVSIAGTAGWLLSLIIIIFSFVGVVILYKLYRPFNGKDILDIANFTGGEKLEFLIGILALTQILYGGVVVAREFGESFNIIALPNSPVGFIIFLLMLGSGVVACLGLKTIARLASMLAKIVIGGIVLILLGVINKFKIVNLYPILGNANELSIRNGIVGMSWFSGILAFFILMPFLKDKDNSKKVAYKIIGFPSFVIFIVTLVYQGVFSYPCNKKQMLPLYALSRSIRQGQKIERIEAVFLIIWVLSALTFITLATIIIAYLFKKLFRLKHDIPLVLSIIVIIFSCSVMYKNIIESEDNFVSLYRRISFITAYIMPFILLIFANLKIHKEKNKNV